MPRKRDKQPPKQVGNLGDPQGMAVYLEKFLEWMRVKNYSVRTIDKPPAVPAVLHRVG